MDSPVGCNSCKRWCLTPLSIGLCIWFALSSEMQAQMVCVTSEPGLQESKIACQPLFPSALRGSGRKWGLFHHPWSLSYSSFFLGGGHVANGILVSCPGIKSRSSSLEVQSFNYWISRKVPPWSFSFCYLKHFIVDLQYYISFKYTI